VLLTVAAISAFRRRTSR